MSTMTRRDAMLDGWEVNVNWVDYPPGRVGNPHRHPGFTLAYVSKAPSWHR